MFLIPSIAVLLGILIILLIKSTSPEIQYERMGSEERLDPGEPALRMEEEEFRIFVTDFFQHRGYLPTKIFDESEGVFVMVLENPRPVFGGKYAVKCIRGLEARSVASKEVARFREIVKGERGARGILISTLPFTIEAQQVAHDLGIELVGPSGLRTMIETGDLPGADGGPANEPDPARRPG